MCPCVVKLLMLAIFTLLVEGNGVYYEIPALHRCPSEDFSCCSISNCPATWNLLKNGIQPKVCGWLHRTPLVCCPHYINQEHHYVHQTSDYLDEEPYYVPQKHLYNRRPSSIGEETVPFHKGTPSIVEISSSIQENLPSVGYSPSSVILPVVEYLPSKKRLPPVRHLPPNERILPSIRYFHSGGKRLPSRGDLPSGDRWLLSTGDLPSGDKWLPSTGNLSSNKRRIPPISNETPSATDSPSRGITISPTGEETPFNDVEIPSSERRRPSTAENPDLVNAIGPQPTEERKPLIIRSGSNACGRRRVDRSSNVPESGHSIDTNSSETNTSAPEEEEGTFEISVVGGARANDKWTWMNYTRFRGVELPLDQPVLIASKRTHSRMLFTLQSVQRRGLARHVPLGLLPHDKKLTLRPVIYEHSIPHEPKTKPPNSGKMIRICVEGSEMLDIRSFLISRTPCHFEVRLRAVDARGKY